MPAQEELQDSSKFLETLKSNVAELLSGWWCFIVNIANILRLKSVADLMS